MYRNMPPKKKAVKAAIDVKPAKKIIPRKVRSEKEAASGDDPATIIIASVDNYFASCGIYKEYYRNGPYITIYLYFLKGEEKI